VWFLFLDPQDEVGPSISSSVVLCSFVLLVNIVVLVLVVCLCPSSVRVVATFSGTVLFPLLCSVLPFFASYIDSFLYLVLLFQVSVSKISIIIIIIIIIHKIPEKRTRKAQNQGTRENSHIGHCTHTS